MIPHKSRSHAEWSASATSRNVVCAGAIAMETLVEEDESEAAAWGTCAHEIAEQCLRNDAEPEVFRDQERKIGRFTFTVGDDMIDCVQTYVDYVSEEVKQERCQFWIELNLSLSSLKPALEAGGTGDFILYRPESKLLKIIDLKGGRGVVVKAEGNAQLRTYALGALLNFLHLNVEQVEVAIVQPRAQKEPSVERFHVADLLEWAAWLLERIETSATALKIFQNIGGNRVLFDEWAERWLKTGQCTFCRAKGICPKFRGEALASIPERARQWFEGENDAADLLALSNHPALASPEEIGHILDGLDALDGWINAIRERAHREAERGVAIPGYVLVDKIGRRAWLDGGETEQAVEALLGEKAWVKKLVSPAQAEKALGKKRINEIAGLWHSPVTGTNLVSAAKTTRPSVSSKPETYFEKVEN